MQAVILAGGMGTRLSSVVSDRPKPMALVEKKPFLEYTIKLLKENGIREIIMAVGYMGGMIEEYFKDGSAWNLKITYSYEKDQLGTAGAIKNAEKYMTEDEFWILNGDTYFQLDYQGHYQFFVKSKSEFFMVLRQVEDMSRYGSVIFDQTGRIKAFEEKKASHGPGYINGGVYLMRRELLNVIPSGVAYSLENDFLPTILKGQNIFGQPDAGYFIDIGIPDDYFKFQQDIKKL